MTSTSPLSIRDRLKTLPERKALVRAVLQPMQRGKRDRTVVSAYNRLASGNDGRVHTGISVATTTMRLASSETITEDASCLTGDSEILTPEGWRRFDSLKGDTITAMQWEPSGVLSWCAASVVRHTFAGDLVVANSWYHRHRYTPNHRIIYQTSSAPHLRVTTIDQMERASLWHMPTSGTYTGGSAPVSPDLARFLAALQADGCVSKQGFVYFGFKKARKIKRLKTLLKCLGWKYSLSYSDRPDGRYTRIHVPREYAEAATHWLPRGNKVFGSWLLSWPQESLRALIQETAYWDGHRRNKSHMYFTVRKENVEWLTTTAHLAGWSASYRLGKNRNKGSYGEHTAKPLYTVNFKPRSLIVCEAKHFSRSAYRGIVYCLTTPTSYFLVRTAERITVTGNSNLQNLANKIRALDPLYDTREVMQADPGFRLCARDFSGAELLLVFSYSRDWEWVDKMIAGEKVHEQHCKEFFNLPCHWSEVKKKYPDRYITGKNITFLSTYSGGVATATRTFNKDYPIHGQRTTEKEVARIQQVLYDLHPLKAWWQEVDDQITRDGGNIINAFGYVRPLRDPDPHMRLKDALAQLPQSTVAWRMNESLCEFHDTVDRQGQVELLHQVHDELIFMSLPETLEASLAASKRIMEKKFKIHGRTLYIPTEAKVSELGGSWGRMEGYRD